MKKTLLFGLLAVLVSFNMTAQIVCYGEEEASAPDFWLSHFYFAKCTNYIGTGSKIFSGDADYVDFNGGSRVDYTNVFVSKDGMYTVQLSYGVGYAEPEAGGIMDVIVNDELAEQLIFYSNPNRPLYLEFDVELYADYANIIQFKQRKDWMIMLGIQLAFAGESGISKVNTNPYRIASKDGILSITDLKGSDNQIRIHSIEGKLFQDVQVKSSSFNASLAPGLYIVNVNGKASKVLVK